MKNLLLCDLEFCKTWFEGLADTTELGRRGVELMESSPPAKKFSFRLRIYVLRSSARISRVGTITPPPPSKIQYQLF